MSDTYVHYGCDAKEYDITKFKEIKNIPFWTKPSGGFWASPKRKEYQYIFDWEAFCHMNNNLPRGGLDQKFFFCLDEKAKVFRIETLEDFNRLPKVDIPDDAPVSPGMEFVDFETCLLQGIDAIEYDYTGVHREETTGDEMDIKLLGWDCDSILILNPKIILKENFNINLNKSEGDMIER